jgi:hypothetical protein
VKDGVTAARGRYTQRRHGHNLLQEKVQDDEVAEVGKKEQQSSEWARPAEGLRVEGNVVGDNSAYCLHRFSP